LMGGSIPVMQRLAGRFLKHASAADWDAALPPAQLPDGLRPTLVFCPGFINGLLPVHAFEHEFRALQAEGWSVLCADAHPVRGCEANVADLMAALNEGRGFMPVPGAGADVELVSGPPPGDVVLMGYSKGSPDILCLLAAHPELRTRVRAVVTWAGAIGGSFTADKIHDLIQGLPLDAVAQHLNDFLTLLVPGMTRKGSLRRLDEYAIKEAVASLTTREREAFLARHGAALDALDIPFFNITAATSLFEVPTFQMADYLSLAKADPDNDMQVTQAQARMTLPMATHLATLHGHHWDVSYPPFPRKLRMASPNLDHPFPRHAGVLANLQLVMELGLAS
ncbi:MAG: hypothetical protein VW625_10505, partial [Perlucidibaca sp.]